jgi:hypothetical protein
LDNAFKFDANVAVPMKDISKIIWSNDNIKGAERAEKGSEVMRNYFKN